MPIATLNGSEHTFKLRSEPSVKARVVGASQPAPRLKASSKPTAALVDRRVAPTDTVVTPKPISATTKTFRPIEPLSPPIVRDDTGAAVARKYPSPRKIQIKNPTRDETISPVHLIQASEPAAESSVPIAEKAEEVDTGEPLEDLEAATNFGLKPMSQMSAVIAVPKGDDDFPEDVAAARFAREEVIGFAQCVGRDWGAIDYRWEASLLCHGPLLFEQLNAERYGLTYGSFQPVASAAHFFATLPAIPYKVWANGHDQCQYALGYYRPGSYAQPQCYKLRVSADASLFEAGVILGLIFALP